MVDNDLFSSIAKVSVPNARCVISASSGLRKKKEKKRHNCVGSPTLLVKIYLTQAEMFRDEMTRFSFIYLTTSHFLPEVIATGDQMKHPVFVVDFCGFELLQTFW